MDLVVISHCSDVHAHAAIWGFQECGLQSSMLTWLDFPQRLRASFDLSQDRFLLADPDHELNRSKVIWNRRGSPVRPHPSLHEADAIVARRLSRPFLRSFADLHSRGSIWVNNPEASEIAERKATQLSMAKAAGFVIPETIISNDPDRVRTFVQAGPSIVKPLGLMSWEAQEGWVSMLTTKVSPAELWDPIAIEACPMIYQRLVEKRFELRVVVFGDEFVCVKIDSQSCSETSLDWRAVPSSQLKIEPMACPGPLRDLIARFMKASRLVHGSFDFIVGQDGAIYFLEINQQGQFLWLEELDDSIPLMDILIAFLQSEDPSSFQYEPGSRKFSYNEYVTSGQATRDINAAFARHVADMPSATVVEAA